MSKWHLRLVAFLLSACLVGSACSPIEAAFLAPISLRSAAPVLTVMDQQAVMPPLGSFPESDPLQAVRLSQLGAAESKASSTASDPEKALSDLRSTIVVDLLHYDPLIQKLTNVYDVLGPLNWDQDIIDVTKEAIHYLIYAESPGEGPTRGFDLVRAHSIQALIWNKLGNIPEALVSVRAATVVLENVKGLARATKDMEKWNLAQNGIRLAHGQALSRRWEQTKSDQGDLLKARDLLTSAVAGIPVSSRHRIPVNMRAMAVYTLGWVQFYLGDLSSAADSAVQAIALNPQNPDALRLGETVQHAIHLESQMLEQQQARFAELDAALKAHNERAASDALDQLVSLHWPEPQVVYYRGLLAFNSGDYARAAKSWSGSSMNDLMAIEDAEDEKIKIQHHLIEAQVRIGDVRTAMAMAQSLIQRNSPDAALAQILVDAQPGEQSYAIMTEALADLQINPQVKAFVRELENALGRKQPAPLWAKEVRASLLNLISVQRPARDKWDSYSPTQKSNRDILEKFFSQEPWKSLSPEDKASLLLSWVDAFLTIGKFRDRQPAVARFITEARKVVEVSMEKNDRRLPKVVLTSLREKLVTGLSGLLTSNAVYQQSKEAVTPLNRQIQSALSFYQAQEDARVAAESLEQTKRERDARIDALSKRWDSLEHYIVKLDPIAQRHAIVEAQTQRAALFAESSEFPEERVVWAAPVDKWLSEAEDHYEAHESVRADELVHPWEENLKQMWENLTTWDHQWYVEGYVQLGETLAADQASHPLVKRPEVLDAQAQFRTAVRKTRERIAAHEKFTFDKWLQDGASIIETWEPYGKDAAFWTDYLRALNYADPLVSAFIKAIEADVPVNLVYVMMNWLIGYHNYRVQARLISLEDPIAESQALADAMIEKLIQILETNEYRNEPVRARLVLHAA